MKKKILIFALTAVMVLLMNIGAFAQEEISVYLNDKQVSFPDRTPVISEGVLLIPLRSVFEAMDIDVYWAGDTSTVVCASDEVKVILQIGNTLLFINNDKIQLETAPVIIDDRTMITKEVVEKVFGLSGEYDADGKTVVFKKEPR